MLAWRDALNGVSRRFDSPAASAIALQSTKKSAEKKFSADLCYDGANEKPSSGRKVAAEG